MDKEAFSRRVTAMQGSLYRVAASYLAGEADRLDAVSEAIAKAWAKRGTLREERYFETWLTRILIRECVSIQRKQKRAIPMDVMPERPKQEDEAVLRLRDALNCIPQRLRTMVVLHYMEGYDVRETAHMMGTTKGAVCAGLSRARQALREWMEEDA